MTTAKTVQNTFSSKEKIIKKLGIIGGVMTGMTGIMTAMMTAVSRPEGETYLSVWIPAWALVAFLVAPVGLSLLWLLGSFYDHFPPNLNANTRKLLLGLTMALIMESFIAFITTFQLYGLSDDFSAQWLQTLIAGLPIAAVMIILGPFVIRPWMEKVMAD